MKKFVPVLVVLGFSFLSSYAYAGIECLNRVSNAVTTPDWHCSKHCGDWANTRPMQTLTLDMDKKYKDMAAFFKNPSASCSGADLCGFSSIPAPTVSANGEQVSLSFKTWSRPVVVSVSADICILNSAVPPVSGETTQPKPSNPSAPSPTTASKPKLPLPPQKEHVTGEAGSLTADNCERMKKNWLVDAGAYCSPYHVNFNSTSLSCSQSSDALFSKVSGVFLCME